MVAEGSDDLRSARILLEADPPVTDVVCFHCQQAAEKYLKSFLIYHEVEPPYTHNLPTLLSLCVQQDASLQDLYEQAESLNPFAVHGRYPTLERPTDVKTATGALVSADAIREAVRSRLPEMR